MPTNATAEYSAAEIEYQKAGTTEEKLKALENMLREAPSHKGAENLRSDIKNKIAKIKGKIKKEKAQKKVGYSISIKKEGAAQVLLVGTTNSGKSTLLNKLTGSNAKIATHPFTTIKPEIGMLDYKGIKIQIVELPAIVKNFEETENGRAYLAIMKQAELIVLLFSTPEEYELLRNELYNIETRKIIYNENSNIADDIWRNLNLIKVYTKEPGKKPAYLPISLQKNSTVADLAKTVHKDFLKKFRFARIWGSSAKFGGQQVGLTHKLEDDDIVEVHLK